MALFGMDFQFWLPGGKFDQKEECSECPGHLFYSFWYWGFPRYFIVLSFGGNATWISLHKRLINHTVFYKIKLQNFGNLAIPKRGKSWRLRSLDRINRIKFVIYMIERGMTPLFWKFSHQSPAKAKIPTTKKLNPSFGLKLSAPSEQCKNKNLKIPTKKVQPQFWPKNICTIRAVRRRTQGNNRETIARWGHYTIIHPWWWWCWWWWWW